MEQEISKPSSISRRTPLFRSFLKDNVMDNKAVNQWILSKKFDTYRVHRISLKLFYKL